MTSIRTIRREEETSFGSQLANQPTATIDEPKFNLHMKVLDRPPPPLPLLLFFLHTQTHIHKLVLSVCFQVQAPKCFK